MLTTKQIFFFLLLFSIYVFSRPGPLSYLIMLKLGNIVVVVNELSKFIDFIKFFSIKKNSIIEWMIIDIDGLNYAF